MALVAVVSRVAPLMMAATGQNIHSRVVNHLTGKRLRARFVRRVLNVAAANTEFSSVCKGGAFIDVVETGITFAQVGRIGAAFTAGVHERRQFAISIKL